MSISKQRSYDPKAVEKKLYEKWEQSGIFKPGEKGIPYCIALPPPNVTGSLHMGHAFQDTLMDILIRYKRMSGRKTLWQGGTDHAGIATQIVVERQLESAGKSRQEIGREKFVEAVWDWKKKSGGTISKQLRRMGSSIDWSRERFTLDDDLSLAVRQVFVSLYSEGLIYKGKRLVNWDPVLKTAISDLEVISEMEKGYLWHFKYPIKNSKQFVIIATTRPETLLGDSAVAVNPLDDRYKTLIGKTVELPLTNREIPIIADNYVDKEFGSGCLKVTPAHDFNDYEIGKRHNLEVINILQEDGHLNSSVPDNFVGLERYEARKKIVSEMDRRGLLAKTEEHQLMVPRGDRTRTIIEPFLTDQWFVSMEALARPALDAVRNGEIKFVPQSWAKTYYDWLENIQDWCISRQLWWGHRIPAWYDAQGNIFVGMNEKDVRRENSIPSDNILRQDEDVLDTWFSSALWPFSTLGWPKETKELSTFYPTSVLVTGFDIIFFWVARMIMMGLKIMGAVPFREVYIHGLVRDSEGNKMSKSKGNIIDPIDLIDGITLEELVTKRTSNLMHPEDAVSIEKNTKKDFPDGIPAFGTDALRLTFAAMATTGRDIRFDLGRIGGYRNFCNKVWNASRFVVLTLKEHSVSEKFTTGLLGEAENWIYFRLEMTLNLVRKNFDSYRFDLASNAIYEFIWDDFCDWYIESSKVTLSDPSSTPERKQVVLQTLIDVMQTALSALHPIMPFISEALWNELEACQDNPRTFSSIVFPTETKFKGNKKSHDQFELIKKFVLEVRRIRSSYNVNPKQEITTFVNYPESKINNYFGNNIGLVRSLGRISSIKTIPQSKLLKIATGLADKITIYIPLEDLVDIEAERVRLKRDLGKLKSSKGRITQKLKNKNFLSKAPKEVIRKEEEKLIEIDIAIDHTEKQIINFQ